MAYGTETAPAFKSVELLANFHQFHDEERLKVGISVAQFSQYQSNIVSRENKKLVYKQVGGFSNGETLQLELHEALARHAVPSKRIESLGASGRQVRFINVYREYRGLLLGVFHRLRRGVGEQVVAMPDAGKEWPVITTSKNKKLQSEMVEGTLFFGVWNNHLVMHQSNACRADQFEDYCSWLLSTGHSNLRLDFSDPIPPDIRKKSRQPVTSIKFGSSLAAKAIPNGAQAEQARVHFSPAGGVWDGVKSILRAVEAPVSNEWLLVEALNKGDIRVALKLSCTRKKAGSAAGVVLRSLGESLRCSEADTFEVRLKDGTKIRSEQMKVETNVQVECARGLPVPESIFKSMVEWMGQLADDGIFLERESFANAE